MSNTPFELGVITGDLAPELSDEGQRLAVALDERGFSVEPVHWNDATVTWADYDGVLFRSCWEYPEDIPRFRALLDALSSADVQVGNPLSVIRWNLHKRYLFDLADAGVRVPPTVLLDRGSDRSLETVLVERGWTDAVVKPGIGAMSTDVWRTSLDEAAGHQGRFEDLLAEQDVLVQAYLPEITDGEQSIVCFGGVYSHAWNSLPAPNDVTTFEDIDAEYRPTGRVREQAVAAIGAACSALDLDGDSVPYARVDYVTRDGDLVLLELELIEPYLGFARGQNTVERFRDELARYFDVDG